jgi:two-component system nitrogen regulation sensor histidine kinase NtrY
MGRNRFYITIILRVVLITATCFAFIYIITQTNRPATTLFLGILIVLQTIGLIHYVNLTNRELARFLIYLKENDTTAAFSRKNIEKTFKGLFQSFEEIAKSLQKARIDKEQEHQYLKTIVEHVGTGLISFDQEGKVRLINKTAKSLLNIENLSNIRSLDSLKSGFADFLINLKVNEQKLIALHVNNEILQLSLRSTILKTEGKPLHIVALHNIKNELDERELESWQKLIRILRHEIMNSITPITTLTTAIKRCFKTGNRVKSFSEINEENIKDALGSTEVIEERSKGLIEFVEKYKSLTSLPELKLENIELLNLFYQIKILLNDELTSRKIKLEMEVIPENLKIMADKKLMEQVMINLLKNAIQSIDKKGIISMKAKKVQDKYTIQVIDNGPGIGKEELENIFIPFYSTREGGSGIGLNISRQIIRKHQGNIHVYSLPHKETIFTISLPEVR